MRIALNVLASIFLFALLAAAPATQPATRPATTQAFGPSEAFTTGPMYKQVGAQKLFMLTHFPDGWAKSDRRPCVVLFYGGSWNSRWSSLYDEYCAYLANRGFVVLRPDYRIGQIEPCVEDAKSAIRYAREHAAGLGIDPQKVIATGGSSGGHLALATAVLPGFEGGADAAGATPNAVIALCPVVDLTGGKREKEMGHARVAALSPILHLGEQKPVPTIIIVAANDDLVDDCRKYEEKASAMKLPTELKVLPGGGHAFFVREPGRTILFETTERFLRPLHLWPTP